ncbi:MAG: phosphate signaling complex protein PhoU [Dehalococcoidia bacterium]
MPRELFRQELEQIQDSVLALGSMAEKAVVRAMNALRDSDAEESQRIIRDDGAINERRFEIEAKTMFVVASQQPMAGDLRALASVLYIITDLERIADHAEGIAKINLMLDAEPPPRPLGYLPAMADRAVAMMHDSMKAYLDRDVDLARAVADRDDEVDALQDRVYEEVIGGMIEARAAVKRNTYMLWCAHNLERIADRVTNICERVVYMVTGDMTEVNVSKY